MIDVVIARSSDCTGWERFRERDDGVADVELKGCPC